MTALPASGAVQSRAAKGVWAGLVLAVSMTTIDQTIVALSSPSIQDHLSISHADLQWAVNAYLLTTASFFLLGGRLADLLGHRRMALIGIAGFGVTSLLCGLTPEGSFAAPWLITARALQGVSGALMFPAAIGIVVQSFPRERRGRAMATFFTITGAMTAIGPVAGGYLTQWTWRSIFWINVPVAVAAAILTVRMVPRSKGTAGTVDWRGAAVSAVAMALVVFGLQQAGAWGWTSPGVWVPIAVGALTLVRFVGLERRTPMPLVNLEVMRDRGFAVSTLAMFFASVAFISVFFFLSVYGQVSLRLPVGDTGLLLLKFFIGFAVAARLGSARFDRHGARPVVLMGGVVGTVGFLWLARTATDLGFDASAFLNRQTWPLLVAGAGIGFMFSPVSTDALNRAIGASYGEVSAVTQTVKNFGGALGLALFSTLVTHRLTQKLTDSILAVGGTSRDAGRAVDAVTGGDPGAAGGLAAGNASALRAVRVDYASAAQVAFYGMAGAMAVVALLAWWYPRGSGTREAS
ncbi:MFS transporter [Streptomyces liangshanensis]|uniref:MFS transporter n=1 Tax=Streptomyces liangshanensis TaxID=2717324 RepID=A0A6G9H680_9ACTN|nr:MFS transporter [Streptomyces liangshanensis]QIQ06045.1 MFS transporter [Streptomyces liangshanensis]